jgi:hypothetical protein
MKRTSILCLPALALLALTTMGCSTRERSICDKYITCEGGNDADKSACVDNWIQRTQIAGAYNCGDAWSKYLDCMDASAICSSGKLKTDTCSAQNQAVATCVNAASAYGVK